MTISEKITISILLKREMTQQHIHLAFRKIIYFYLIFCSPKVSATKADMPIKKKKAFSTNYLFYGIAMAARGGGNCRLSCRKIVAPHLLKLNNTLHPSRRHNRAILNIYVSYTDRCNSFVTNTVIGIWNCIHSQLKCCSCYRE
jgi:hypothetical protein